MICFRDMTFCKGECGIADCPRRWTPELAAEARKWWGGDDAPVAFSDFCGVTSPLTMRERFEMECG